MVRYSGPRSYAQAIRQRYSALAPTEVLVAVEGATDKRALMPIFRPEVKFVPAGGRDMLLGAYSELASEGLDRCLFIADCDNSFPPSLKGLQNLVITEHRDIESDALFCLRGFDRIAIEYLASPTLELEEVELQRDEILLTAVSFSSLLATVKDEARQRGMVVRWPDPVTGRRTRLSFEHLPTVGTWINSQQLPTPTDLAIEVGRALGWSPSDAHAVGRASESSWSAVCAPHATAECGDCRLHRHSNGHDLVSALAIDLSGRLTTSVTPADLDRDIRMATDRTLTHTWHVGRRIRAWESSLDLSILRST